MDVITNKRIVMKFSKKIIGSTIVISSILVSLTGCTSTHIVQVVEKEEITKSKSDLITVEIIKNKYAPSYEAGFNSDSVELVLSDAPLRETDYIYPYRCKKTNSYISCIEETTFNQK
jgi:hypothetical protein